jgi:hypothetical protein
MAGLGISRGGIVAQPAGGGGAPPGIATIWPSVADWADLSTVAGPLRDGDQVFVSDLGSPASIGLARYDEGDAQWALQFGMFASFADMEAFAEPIVTGALAGVQESASDDETAVRYQYESGWARTAVNQPYVWTSSSVSDIANTDPSGIGVTRVGDILRLTLANGVATFQLVAFTTAGGSAVNASVWVPSDWLSSGTVLLRGRLVGTEASRSGTGLSDLITGSGPTPTITGATDTIWTRMNCANVASALAGVQVTSLTLGSGQQAYTRCITRAQGSGTIAGSTSTVGLFTGDGSRGSIARQIGTGAIRYDNGSGVALNSGTIRGNGGTALPTSGDGDLLEQIDEGRTLMTLLRRNGGPYHMCLRDQAATASTFVGALCTNTNLAPGTAYMDIREFIVITRAP